MRLKNKTCYMCDRLATSREHVPPKSLFPEDEKYRRNLICVPSCDLHNGEKKLDDEYLRMVLCINFIQNEHSYNIFTNKFMKSVEHNAKTFLTLMRNLKPISIKNIETGKIEDSASFTADIERIKSILHHIGCGIYFHETGQKWKHGSNTACNFVICRDDSIKNAINNHINECRQSFINFPALGSNPEIFTYKYSSSEAQAVIHITFYESCEATILLDSKYNIQKN